jgi:hypothetical protein
MMGCPSCSVVCVCMWSLQCAPRISHSDGLFFLFCCVCLYMVPYAVMYPIGMGCCYNCVGESQQQFSQQTKRHLGGDMCICAYVQRGQVGDCRSRSRNKGTVVSYTASLVEEEVPFHNTKNSWKEKYGRRIWRNLKPRLTLARVSSSVSDRPTFACFDRHKDTKVISLVSSHIYKALKAG